MYIHIILFLIEYEIEDTISVQKEMIDNTKSNLTASSLRESRVAIGNVQEEYS